MSDAKVDLTVQDGGAVAAWQKHTQAILAFLAAQKTLTDEERKAAQVEQDLNRIRDQVLRGLKAEETASQKYARQIGELNRLKQAGKLTEQEYARAVNRTKKELDDSSKAGVKGFEAMTTKVLGLAAGFIGLRTGISFFMTANEQILEQANKIGRTYDELFRKLQVQTGLDDVQGVTAKIRVLDRAEKYSVNEDNAAAASTQLASSGFSQEDATGGALDVVLQGLASSNKLGENPVQLTQALGQFLAAQGLEKNTANLERVVVGTQRLFKGTDLQISDLTQLSGKSQGLAGKMSPEEVLATFDVLREKTDADKASTALKIFGERVTGATEDKERSAVLKQLGLKPEDVDLKGEDIQTVLDRLAQGFDAVKPERRSGLLQKFFGTEAASPIEGLLRDRGNIAGALDKIKDREGFASDVRTGTEGSAAAERRLAVQNRRAKVKRDDLGDLYRTSLETEALAGGYTPFQTGVALKGFDTARNLGVSPEAAVKNVLLPSDDNKQLLIKRTLEGVDKALAPEAFRQKQQDEDQAWLEEQRALRKALEANTAATKENTKPAPPAGRANTKPTGTRPAAVGQRP